MLMGWREFLGVEASTNTEFIGLHKYLGVHIKHVQKIIVTYLIANSLRFLLDSIKPLSCTIN